MEQDIKYCNICGKALVTVGRGKQRFYCSAACSQKSKRFRQKEKYLLLEESEKREIEKNNIIQKQLEIVKKKLSIAKKRQIAISDFLQKKNTKVAIFEKAESDLRGKIDNINKLKNIHNLKENILLHDKLIELIKNHQLWFSENLQQMIKIFRQRRSAT